MFGVKRNVIAISKLALSTSSCSRQARKTADPIQQQFVNKIRLYFQKQALSGEGTLVDASPQIQSELKEELQRLSRIYGVTDDTVRFPSLTFPEAKFNIVTMVDEAAAERQRLEQVDESSMEETAGTRLIDWMEKPLETEGYALEIFSNDGNYKEPTYKEVIEDDYLLCEAEQEELYDDDKFVFYEHLPQPQTIPEVENITTKDAKKFDLIF
ncbi:ATP synthase-coupling factor 6, mitochondrial [Trichuris trichiura]|uniref:ATP synthase-coupling factor 6, mitochondrial n=1 Tax=Trichuris trichiura TaxID=36087 RepID=A0A077Z6H3_TRITR|nr:ATP synthase-coupling factor 6, mitochondrial [Trichuris trichiura]